VNSTVKVEAGILISELNEILVQNDLALSVCVNTMISIVNNVGLKLV